MSTEHTPGSGPFVVSGKRHGELYSVRTRDGRAICTCAYNPGPEDREELARLIADALNAYALAIAKATGQADQGSER